MSVGFKMLQHEVLLRSYANHPRSLRQQARQQQTSQTTDVKTVEGELLRPGEARYLNKGCDGPYYEALKHYQDVQNGFKHHRPTFSLTV